VHNRRDVLKLILMGSGAVYLHPILSSCAPEARHAATLPQLVVRGQGYATPHAYLKEGRRVSGTPTRVSCDVVVVGAGMSGLTAAAVLHDRGRNVIVLDTEPRTGGAAVTEQIGTASAFVGSSYFIERTETLDFLVKRSGAKVVACPEDGYLINGTLHRELWTDTAIDALAPKSERDAMRRFRDTVLGMGDSVPLYPFTPDMPAPWRALEAQSAAGYLQQFPSAFLRDVMSSYSRSSMGGTLEETSAFCLLNFYISEFGAAYEGQRYTFAGGTSAFTGGLATSLPDVRLGQLAYAIEQGASGCTVRTITSTGEVTEYTCARVIMAVQKFQLPHVIQGYPTDRVAAVKSMRYAPYVTIHVRSTAALMPNDVYDVWDVPSGPHYTDIINPMSVDKATAKDHVVSLFMPLPVERRKDVLDEDKLAAIAGTAVDHYLSTLTDTQREQVVDVRVWPWGHMLVVPQPGIADTAMGLAKPLGRIIFANTDNDSAPAIENAIDHGRRAAESVLNA
jgi:protoporphyrinogen oxidase